MLVCTYLNTVLYVKWNQKWCHATTSPILTSIRSHRAQHDCWSLKSSLEYVNVQLHVKSKTVPGQDNSPTNKLRESPGATQLLIPQKQPLLISYSNYSVYNCAQIPAAVPRLATAPSWQFLKAARHGTAIELMFVVKCIETHVTVLNKCALLVVVFDKLTVCNLLIF